MKYIFSKYFFYGVLIMFFMFFNYSCTKKKEQAKPKKKDYYTLQEEAYNDLINKKRLIITNFEHKKLYIYLPESYYESNKRYPVVYAQDGQNLFPMPKNIGSYHKWRIDEVLDKLVKNKQCEEMIIVGIEHAGSGRAIEYLPATISNLSNSGLFPSETAVGTGKQYAEWIAKKLVPFIDENYLTIKDRNNRMIMGSSFGGQISLYTAFTYPDVFGTVASLSSSGGWLNDEIVKKFKKQDITVYLDAGTKETRTMGGWNWIYCMLARDIVDTLISKGFNYGKNLFYYEEKDGSHNELDWNRRLSNPLILFKGDQSENGLKVKNIDLQIYRIRPIFHYSNMIIANPVANLENGFKYSLLSRAKYSTRDSNGTINSKGIMYNFKDGKIIIDAEFNNFKLTGEIEITNK